MVDRYGTPAGFRTYIIDRGIVVVGADDDDSVNPALLVGAEWLDARYRCAFSGVKKGRREQTREWPRLGASDVYGNIVSDTSVPIEIEHATYIVAIRQMTSPGSLSVDYQPNKYSEASVAGAVSVKYRSFNNAFDAQVKIQGVDEALSNLIDNDDYSGGYSGEAGRG